MHACWDPLERTTPSLPHPERCDNCSLGVLYAQEKREKGREERSVYVVSTTLLPARLPRRQGLHTKQVDEKEGKKVALDPCSHFLDRELSRYLAAAGRWWTKWMLSSSLQPLPGPSQPRRRSGGTAWTTRTRRVSARLLPCRDLQGRSKRSKPIIIICILVGSVSLILPGPLCCRALIQFTAFLFLSCPLSFRDGYREIDRRTASGVTKKKNLL